MIHLSPCLKVPADTPIRDCILKMNQARVGSILVVGDRAEDRGLLQGIFTERDVLRNFALLQSEELAAKPARTLMSRNVITLEMHELDEAATIMIKKGVRHLPVVAGTSTQTHSSDPDRTLLGVISIRDVLRWQIEGSPLGNSETSGPQRNEVQLLLRSDDHAIKSLLSSVIRTMTKAGWNFRMHVPGSGKLLAPDITLLDLDRIPPKDWKGEVVELAGRKTSQHESLILFFDPAKHDEKTQAQLAKLDGSIPGLSIFVKPVDLLGLVAVLGKAAETAHFRS